MGQVVVVAVGGGGGGGGGVASAKWQIEECENKLAASSPSSFDLLEATFEQLTRSAGRQQQQQLNWI